MEQWSIEEAEQVMEQVTKRSMEDPEFRALALRDAHAAIAKINTKPLPAGYRVQFVDNAGASRTFVLPDPIPANAELTDEELEQVAGGGRNRCNYTTCNGTAGNDTINVNVST